jgi:hypothetical protein
VHFKLSIINIEMLVHDNLMLRTFPVLYLLAVYLFTLLWFRISIKITIYIYYIYILNYN